MSDNLKPGIALIKFEPERHWAYRPRAWLAKALWAMAYWIHPVAPKFRQQIADEFHADVADAKRFLAEFEKSMLKAAGIESNPESK